MLGGCGQGQRHQKTNDSGVAGIVSPQETILLFAYREGIIWLGKEGYYGQFQTVDTISTSL